MTKKASTKKSHVKVNPRVSDVYEDTEGFTGQATSHRGVVIRKAKGGFEAPRYGLENYRSLGAIKSAIEKLMKEKEGATTKDAEGNEVKTESCESSKDKELYTERYRNIISRAKDIILSEMSYLDEGRAEDAQASLAKVKARQKVLDAHEKKTGKKLDITKTPEHKQHKMRFPGAKRTGKKVKGAKETELQQHNRRVTKHNERLIKKGPTTKEKAKQAGYDAYEKKHKRGNKSVWD